MPEIQCPICKLKALENIVKELPNGVDGYFFSCLLCGKFNISRTAFTTAMENSFSTKLSSWIRNYNDERKELPEFDSENLKSIEKNLTDYSPSDKQLILLRNIERRTKYPGQDINFKNIYDYPLAWAENEEEFQYYIKALSNRGLIDSSLRSGNTDTSITPDGWDFLDENRKLKINSDQVFVAMSFAPEFKSLYANAIKPAINNAGYKDYRVDIEPHNGRIDAKIITEIKNSQFLVADVTGQRQGVYFEAGYAIGLGLPVIWSVRNDEIDKVHFDTRQYFHNVWETEEELLDMLYNSICAVIGKRI